MRALLALPPGWTDRAGYLRARSLPPVRCFRPRTAVPVGDLLMSPATLEALRGGVVERLAAHHAAAPDQPGLQLERLRMATPGRPSVAAFRAMVETLFRRGAVEQDGPWLRLPDASRNAVGAGRARVAAGARPDRRRSLPSTAHARSGTRTVGAGGGDAHDAEARAPDGPGHRGGARPVLPE